MIENQKLTENFDLYSLTVTSHQELQDLNRIVTGPQIEKLTALAKLLEHVIFVLNAPLTVTSGYRCPNVNRAVGSTDRSQHLLCEAADFIPKGLDLGEAFRTLWRDIKDNGTNVGQLIYETDERSYGHPSWIHVSLGTPYREKERCKQILRMQNGEYRRLA